MKLSILLGLIAIFVGSTNALQCWKCEGLSSDDCLTQGTIEQCIGEQTACQTTERKRDDSFLYHKGCKQELACANNVDNNQADCHRDQIESTCRCCCFTDLCDQFSDDCSGGILTPPNPDITTAPPPEPPTNRCYCQRVEDWPFGDVECDPSLSNGLWIVGNKCRYTCGAGQVFGEGVTSERECRPAIEEPVVDTDLVYVWKPDAPICVDDPGLCLDDPFWREDTPGPNGTIDCGPRLPEAVGYSLGHICSYVCPQGYFPVGETRTICGRIEENGEFVNRFRPANPCCEKACDTDREADLLFVVDWSSSITLEEWQLMRFFLSNITFELRENENLRFGVVVFGNGVQVGLNIKFDSFSSDLLTEMRTIPYNGEEAGTHTTDALQFVSQTVFGTDEFGDRPDVDNLVVFVTDGVSTDGNDTVNVQTAAADLHNLTDTVYSVGVGLNRIQFETNKVRAMEELKTIAQTEENFFVAEEFDQLGQILHEVTQIACERLCAGFEQEL